MRALKVEFAAKKAVPRWLWFGLTLVFGALAAHQGWQAWVLQERVQALRAEIEVLAAQQFGRTAQAQREAVARLPVERPYARDAAAVAKIAAFPLDRVFASLESAQVQGVKLTGMNLPERSLRPASYADCGGWIRLSAGMPSCLCNRHTMAIVNGRRRASTSYTRLSRPIIGSRSPGTNPC